MAYTHCFRCDKRIEASTESHAVGSGVLKPLCQECSEEVPEHTLWDDSEFDPDAYGIPDKSFLPEGEDWAIVRRDNEEYFKEQVDHQFGISGAPDDMGSPDTDKWDIWVHDANDTEAIEEAREEGKKRFG